MLPLAGLLVGTIMGATARWNHFCTLSALERHWYAQDSNGLRTWVLAATVALVCTQLMLKAGWIDLTDSFYLGSSLSLLGAVVGGILFGLGMALVGTCAFGALVRLGSGSMRSLIIVTAIGLAALTAQRGLLGRARVTWLEPFSIDMPGTHNQSIAELFEYLTGVSAPLILAILLSAALFYWVFKSVEFRTNWRCVVTGSVIGLCVSAGWLLTNVLSTILFRQVQIESASFVMPPGELVLSLIAVTATIPDYGIGMVVGVVCGSALCANLANDVHWEACDDARELSRHLIGAFLMGVGGVLAAGCTVGQGISAFSTMALSAPIVFVSICVGARIGLQYLIEGSIALPGRSS